jgi:hypothetical protein
VSSLPWENNPLVSSLQAQYLYVRTVAIHRPRPPTPVEVGQISYQGLQQTTAAGDSGEDIIQTGVACAIQCFGLGKAGGPGITKSDSPGPVQWRIFFSPSALSKGALRDRDILIDDEGYRYDVGAAYWNVLGYRADCIRLEA